MKNLPTFPVPHFDRRHGFSFLEVMVALFICALMVSAVASSLYTVLRAEQQTIGLRSAGLLMQTLQCRTFLLEQDPDPWIDEFAPTWTLERRDWKSVEGQAGTWDLWHLAPGTDRSLTTTIAFRQDLQRWQ